MKWIWFVGNQPELKQTNTKVHIKSTDLCQSSFLFWLILEYSSQLNWSSETRAREISAAATVLECKAHLPFAL